MPSYKNIKQVRRQTLCLSMSLLVAVNTCISMALSLPLLRVGTQEAGLIATAIGLISFVSHFFLLNFLLGCLIFIISFIVPQRIHPVIKISLFSLFQIVLMIDTKIYSLYYFHINSLVWNIMTTEGVSDSVIIGKSTYFSLFLWSSAILLAEILVHMKAVRYSRDLKPDKLPALKKYAVIIFSMFLCLIVVDKGLYAYGDLYNITAITKNVKLYPLYQPVTIKGFATRVLHMQVDRESGYKYSSAGSLLNYPKKQPVFDPVRDRHYNMVIVVLDGLRFDMLNDEVMPHLSAFAANNIVYVNNYSGGNGTRFGIFSLLYGIHGSYWHTFLAQRRSPVLLDTLVDKGYDFRILSSTRLTFPEFRKTAFIKIPQQITDTFDGKTKAERDAQLTTDFADYLAARNSQKPFFAFLYYNSSHEPFVCPDEFVKFRPVLKGEVDYFRDLDNEKVGMLKNMYKNAIFYEDYLIGRVVESLEEANLLDNTIVVITGDHGEEFFENGFRGHTSSFDDYQLKTAFVMHYPGLGHRVVRRLSSHHDLVPTLMESIGCISPTEEYSQGFSLLDEKDHTYITAANWDTAVMIDNELKVVYSTEMYNMGSFTVHKKEDYSPVGDAAGLLKKKNAQLLDLLSRMSEFYKKK